MASARDSLLICKKATLQARILRASRNAPEMRVLSHSHESKVKEGYQ
jgi:hypothetical protein